MRASLRPERKAREKIYELANEPIMKKTTNGERAALGQAAQLILIDEKGREHQVLDRDVVCDEKLKPCAADALHPQQITLSARRRRITDEIAARCMQIHEGSQFGKHDGQSTRATKRLGMSIK